MGMAVMVLGESGSGKTASLRNFKAGEVFVFNVAGKPMPFKCDWAKTFVQQNSTYESIQSALAKAAANKDNKCKTFVIDDSQYLMVFESFSKAKIVGYGKFTDIAVNFESLIRFIIKELPDDFTVYFLHHTQTDDNTGFQHAKTIGKMLDSQLTVEGLFPVVLMTNVSQGKHTFITNNTDDMSTVKSPIGMFADLEIDNDLKLVDETIRNYYKEGEEGNKNEKD